MTPAAAPLAELLRALAPPLEYLAADDFRRLDQTRLPLPALAERVARARASGPPGAAGPLAELERILAALREGSAGDQERLLRRAHALLPTLREAAAAPPSWSEYQPSAAPVGPALARLAAEQRAELRRHAETHARRVPVRLLFPLVFVVLPAFGLLTVIPTLLAGLSRI